jgi:hypothetical protein
MENVTDLKNDDDDDDVDNDEFDSAPGVDSRLFHQYRFKNGEVGI